jgi:TM2 domain-containing membrane protein YozV
MYAVPLSRVCARSNQSGYFSENVNYMHRSISAALLSAFIFPGAGQLFLRRPRRACVFLVPTLLALLYFCWQVVARVAPIVDQLMAGTVALDPVAIAARLDHAGTASLPMTISELVIILCWAGSIIDAWLTGRAPDPGAR